MHTYTPPYVDWPPPNGYLKILVDQQQGKIDIIPSYLTVSVRYYTCKLSTWNSSITTSNNNSNNSCKKKPEVTTPCTETASVTDKVSTETELRVGTHLQQGCHTHKMNSHEWTPASLLRHSAFPTPLSQNESFPRVLLCAFLISFQNGREFVRKWKQCVCNNRWKEGIYRLARGIFIWKKAFLVGLAWVAVGWMLGRKGGVTGNCCFWPFNPLMELHRGLQWWRWKSYLALLNCWWVKIDDEEL